MRKIFLVLVAILLIAGTAQAIEWQSAMVAESAALDKGKAITSDSSVIMRVWYTGTGASPAVGVSAPTVLLYSDVTAATSTTVNTTATYTTVGAMVDFINSNAGWHASVGDDAYRAMASRFLLRKDYASPGDREDNAYTVLLDTSTATFMSCGILASVQNVPRIFDYHTHLESLGSDMTIDIYEGDTSVYHRFIPNAQYIGTGIGSSSNTVSFTSGIAGTKNGHLCLVIDTSGTFDTNALAKSQNGINIIYDKLAQ